MPGVQNGLKSKGISSRRYWRMPILSAMSLIFFAGGLCQRIVAANRIGRADGKTAAGTQHAPNRRTPGRTAPARDVASHQEHEPSAPAE